MNITQDSGSLFPDVPTQVKLASIAVHADELTSPSGHSFDMDALRALLSDPDVVAYLAKLDGMALIPKKRSGE